MKKSELRHIIKEVIKKEINEWRDGGASADLGKFSAEAERISNASKNASEEELRKKAEEEAAKKAKKGTPKYKQIFNSLFRDVIFIKDRVNMTKDEFKKKYGANAAAFGKFKGDKPFVKPTPTKPDPINTGQKIKGKSKPIALNPAKK